MCYHQTHTVVVAVMWVVAQSCPTLCDPMEYIACQAPLSRKFSRHEYWSGLPFPVPGDLPDPGITPESLASSVLTGRFLTTTVTWEAQIYIGFYLYFWFLQMALDYRSQPVFLLFFHLYCICWNHLCYFQILPSLPWYSSTTFYLSIASKFHHHKQSCNNHICTCSCVYLFEFLLLSLLSIVSDSLWPHGLQHTRLPCPSPSLGACSNSCPSNQWCYPTILSSDVPFSSCFQSFPASGSFPKCWLFTSGSQSIGASASASVLPTNIQGWFLLGLSSLISLQFKGLSSLFQHHSSKASILVW